jgi:hypothetical protein
MTDWDQAIDRIDAEEMAELLGLPVSLMPHDMETLSGGLWRALGLGDEDEPMPESVLTRWEIVLEAWFGFSGWLR